MKKMALLLLIGAWMAAFAQTPPGEEPVAATDAPESAAPCAPASESEPIDGEEVDGEPAAEPCVEPSPETFPEEEPFLGEAPAGTEDDIDEIEDEFGSEIEENNLPTEASVEEEFKPDDEISEDYPVPLPSDI